MTLGSRLALGALALLLASAEASATLVSYTSRTAFLSALAQVGVDTFDDLGPGVELPTGLARSAGSFSYVANAGPASDFFTASDNGTDIWLSTNVATDTVTFSGFSSGVQAIGAFFFASDIAGNSTSASSIGVTASDTDGSLAVSLLTPTTASFLGFISSGTLSSLAVTLGNQPGAWPTVNNVTLGAAVVPVAVPEPPITALMICGFTALFVWRRKEKNS